MGRTGEVWVGRVRCGVGRTGEVWVGLGLSINQPRSRFTDDKKRL